MSLLEVSQLVTALKVGYEPEGGIDHGQLAEFGTF